MSTRCQIVTVDSQGHLYPCKIYKHSDGYPSGVLPILKPFVEAFAAGRGDDPEYFIAQVVRRFMLEDVEHYEKDRADRQRFGDYGNPRTNFLGWGVSTYWHGDIEYLYVCSPDGSIKVLDPDMGRDRNPERDLPPHTDITADAMAEAFPADGADHI